MTVYRHSVVREVTELHEDLIARRCDLPILEQLELRAARIAEAHGAGDVRCAVHLNNWCPEMIGMTPKEVLAHPIGAEHARLATAREHGWPEWSAVEDAARDTPDGCFEQAVDLLLDGQIGLLEGVLDRYPELISTSSRYGHRATLLHYCAANGVETERQRTPSNLPEIVELLLRRGAQADRRARIYGGATALELLESSAHPRAAGVAERCVEFLRLV